MVDIPIPRLNTNDAAYVLVEWLVDDGALVESGATVATVETSKALEDLVTEHTGVLRRLLPAGAECRPGQVVASVTTPSDGPAAVTGPSPVPTATARPPGGTPNGPVITEPARALMREHGLDEHDVAGLGRALIRRSDVESLLAEPARAPQRTGLDTTPPREGGHVRPA